MLVRWSRVRILEGAPKFNIILLTSYKTDRFVINFVDTVKCNTSCKPTRRAGGMWRAAWDQSFSRTRPQQVCPLSLLYKRHSLGQWWADASESKIWRCSVHGVLTPCCTTVAIAVGLEQEDTSVTTTNSVIGACIDITLWRHNSCTSGLTKITLESSQFQFFGLLCSCCCFVLYNLCLWGSSILL